MVANHHKLGDGESECRCCVQVLWKTSWFTEQSRVEATKLSERGCALLLSDVFMSQELSCSCRGRRKWLERRAGQGRVGVGSASGKCK